MSQFLSNKYLRYRGLDQRPARVIDTDQPCTRCSYNLRGLVNNSKCPECGTPIKVAEPARFVLLADAPLADIRKLATGLWLGIACIVAAPPTIVFASGLALRAGGSPWTAINGAIMGIALLWFFAVWRMMPVLETPEAKRYGFTPQSHLRQVARWSQAGWACAIGVIAFVPGGAIAANMLALACILAGLGGLVAVALMLGRLADWSCDEPAGRLLNLTVWLLPASSAVLLAAPFITVARFLSCMALVVWIGSLVTFGLALLSLALSATWSWKHAQDRMNRETELRERIVRRPPPPPASDEPIRLAEKGDPLPNLVQGSNDDAEPLPTLDDIVRDVYCMECGYNLRGLKAYGRCPECGKRIASA